METTRLGTRAIIVNFNMGEIDYVIEQLKLMMELPTHYDMSISFKRAVSLYLEEMLRAGVIKRWETMSDVNLVMMWYCDNPVAQIGEFTILINLLGRRCKPIEITL